MKQQFLWWWLVRSLDISQEVIAPSQFEEGYATLCCLRPFIYVGSVSKYSKMFARSTLSLHLRGSVSIWGKFFRWSHALSYHKSIAHLRPKCSGSWAHHFEGSRDQLRVPEGHDQIALRSKGPENDRTLKTTKYSRTGQPHMLSL